MPDKNITFEIREYLGVISKHDSGWNKELNIISWNGQTPKYDLRDWDPHHERMSRGITMFPGEMRKMVDLYLASNNRRAIEEGQAMEAERNERRAEHRKSYGEKKPEALMEAAEKDSIEGAIPPDQDLEETENRAEEGPAEVLETEAGTSAPQSF